MDKLRTKHLHIKTIYKLVFFLCIILPILLIFVVGLGVLNKKFQQQAIDNICHAQSFLQTELQKEIDSLSVQLSHMIYVNENEIMKLAADTDDDSVWTRFDKEKKLKAAVDFIQESNKNNVGAGFLMKSGRETSLQNRIKRDMEDVRKQDWYQNVVKIPNEVCIYAVDAASQNDLYTGCKMDELILVSMLSPNLLIDRSGKVEMVYLCQTSDVGEKIRANNKDFLAGKNKLGITRICDADTGKMIFQTEETEIDLQAERWRCVSTNVFTGKGNWSIESYIRNDELTKEYWKVAGGLFLIVLAVLLFAVGFSLYFLQGIIKPMESIRKGMQDIEEGNLEVMVAPTGLYEVRNVIYVFNSMVQHLRTLIDDYEKKTLGTEKLPEEYFEDLICGGFVPENVGQKVREMFAHEYVLIILQTEENDKNELSDDQFLRCLAKNPRYSTRCMLYRENRNVCWIYYRIDEAAYEDKLLKMVRELQTAIFNELQVDCAVCISRKLIGVEELQKGLTEVRGKKNLMNLLGSRALINLGEQQEEQEKLLDISISYLSLAEALYVADEKNVSVEKEELTSMMNGLSVEEARNQVYGVILAIAERFNRDGSQFVDIFGVKYNYVEKLQRLDDVRGLRLWINNYFSWILDYSSAKLDTLNSDVIVKAKRYIADHFENQELSLAEVAEYVELNEKYFTNRFTKETGETFSSYLTEIRIQKAKELLRTTNFKVYEIAEMVGYHSAEHFTRMFKKIAGVSPMQFRKG